jgi:hypothetical protein
MGVTLCLDNEAQLGAGLGSRGGSFCLACRDQAAVPSGRGRAREKNAARRENRAASRCSGVQLKAELGANLERARGSVGAQERAKNAGRGGNGADDVAEAGIR